MSVWIFVNACRVYPNRRAARALSWRWLKLCAPFVRTAVFYGSGVFGVVYGAWVVRSCRKFVIPDAFELTLVVRGFVFGEKSGVLRSGSLSFTNSGSSKLVGWLKVRSSMVAKTVVVSSGVGGGKGEGRERGRRNGVVGVVVVTKARTLWPPHVCGDRDGDQECGPVPAPIASSLGSSSW